MNNKITKKFLDQLIPEITGIVLNYQEYNEIPPVFFSLKEAVQFSRLRARYNRSKAYISNLDPENSEPN